VTKNNDGSSTLTHIATIDHTKIQSATLVTARYHLVRWGRTGHKTVWRSHIKRRQKIYRPWGCSRAMLLRTRTLFFACLIGSLGGTFLAIASALQTQNAVAVLAVTLCTSSSTRHLFEFASSYFLARERRTTEGGENARISMHAEMTEIFSDACSGGAMLCVALWVLEIMQLLELKLYIIFQMNLLAQGFFARALLSLLPLLFAAESHERSE